jgi:hypothetical protein
MKRWALLLLAPLVLAAKPSSYDDPESLLRRADAAFAEGRADEAAELYDKAGVRTTKPSLAAYNLATARFRQAREGNLSMLGAAEVNYRACVREGDEFRARALLGLGNCLLLRATTAAAVDRAALRAAMDRFAECMADPGCDAELKADARHNRAKARLLLLQTPPPPEGAEEPPPGDDKEDKEEPQKDPKKDQRDKGDESSQGEGSKDKSQLGKGDEAKAKEGARGEQTAGGNKLLAPPPESAEAPPLAREDAERHLEEAARRIREEAAAFRRGKAKPAAPGVKDW